MQGKRKPAQKSTSSRHYQVSPFRVHYNQYVTITNQKLVLHGVRRNFSINFQFVEALVLCVNLGSHDVRKDNT